MLVVGRGNKNQDREHGTSISNWYFCLGGASGTVTYSKNIPLSSLGSALRLSFNENGLDDYGDSYNGCTFVRRNSSIVSCAYGDLVKSSGNSLADGSYLYEKDLISSSFLSYMFQMGYSGGGSVDFLSNVNAYGGGGSSGDADRELSNYVGAGGSGGDGTFGYDGQGQSTPGNGYRDNSTNIIPLSSIFEGDGGGGNGHIVSSTNTGVCGGGGGYGTGGTFNSNPGYGGGAASRSGTGQTMGGAGIILFYYHDQRL